MTELHINLSISALTLAVACSIGPLADGLSRYLDKAGNGSLALESKKMPTADATVSMNTANTDQQTVPSPDKVAIQ